MSAGAGHALFEAPSLGLAVLLASIYDWTDVLDGMGDGGTMVLALNDIISARPTVVH